LLPFLAEFHKKLPEIRICLSHGKSEDILKRLNDGAIDCGIVHLPVAERIQVKAVKPIQDIFVAGPAYAHLARLPLTLQELTRQPFVMLSAQSRSRAFFHAYLHTYGIDMMPDIELGSVELLIEFVRKGLGLSFITRDFVQEDLAAGTLFELAPAEPVPSRSIGVVTLPDGTLPAAAAYFVKELAAHLQL
jgi:DNA-binding transcriptional LysR family regulator